MMQDYSNEAIVKKMDVISDLLNKLIKLLPNAENQSLIDNNSTPCTPNIKRIFLNIILSCTKSSTKTKRTVFINGIDFESLNEESFTELNSIISQENIFSFIENKFNILVNNYQSNLSQDELEIINLMNSLGGPEGKSEGIIDGKLEDVSEIKITGNSKGKKKGESEEETEGKTGKIEARVQSELNTAFSKLNDSDLLMLDLHSSNNKLPFFKSPKTSKNSFFDLTAKPDFAAVNAPIIIELKDNGSDLKDNKLNDKDIEVITQALERIYCSSYIYEYFKFSVAFGISGPKSWFVFSETTDIPNVKDSLRNPFKQINIYIFTIETNLVYPILKALAKNPSIFYRDDYFTIKKLLEDFPFSLPYIMVRKIAQSCDPVYGIGVIRKVPNSTCYGFAYDYYDFAIKITSNKEVQILNKIKETDAAKYVIKTMTSSNETTMIGLSYLEILAELEIDINYSFTNFVPIQGGIMKKLALPKVEKQFDQLNLSNSWLVPHDDASKPPKAALLMYIGSGKSFDFDPQEVLYCLHEIHTANVLHGDPRWRNMMRFDNIPASLFRRPITCFLIDFDNSFDFEEGLPMNKFFDPTEFPKEEDQRGAIQNNIWSYGFRTNDGRILYNNVVDGIILSAELSHSEYYQITTSRSLKNSKPNEPLNPGEKEEPGHKADIKAGIEERIVTLNAPETPQKVSPPNPSIVVNQTPPNPQPVAGVQQSPGRNPFASLTKGVRNLFSGRKENHN